MHHKPLLFIAMLLSLSVFGQQETKNETVAPKRVNNTLGVCLSAKTMCCNGVSMSYIAAEQGKTGFAYGVEYNREYMLGKTPLGIVVGIRAEYCRPYTKQEIDGQIYELKGNDVSLAIPVMLQYHDQLGKQTQLLLFTGPSLDMVAFRQGSVSMGIATTSSYSFLFGSPLNGGGKPAWNWLNLSWGFGIGIQYKDFIFKVSSAYGLLNHFDKDYTAENLGYPVYINHPVMATVMFKL